MLAFERLFRFTQLNKDLVTTEKPRSEYNDGKDYHQRYICLSVCLIGNSWQSHSISTQNLPPCPCASATRCAPLGGHSVRSQWHRPSCHSHGWK